MSDTSWMVYDYPEPPPEPPVPECAYCEMALTDEVYELYNEIVCEKCFEEQILEEFGWEGIADALGFQHMTRERYLNECI